MNLHQLQDFPEGEAEGLGLANELDAFPIGIRIAAVARGGAGRFAEKFFALVKAEGLNADAGAFG